MHTDNDKYVLKMGADVFRGEGLGAGLLEHDGDNIIPNMSLPQELPDRKTENSMSDFNSDVRSNHELSQGAVIIKHCY